MTRFCKLFFTGTVFLLLMSFSAFPQDAATTAKIKYHTEKVKNYLDKNNALLPYYAINTDGISIYASAQNKLKNIPEFHLNWDQVAAFNVFLKTSNSATALEVYRSGKFVGTFSTSKNSPSTMVNQIFIPETKLLKGYKIAIDAGHTAGDMETGGIEQKCLKFNCDSLKGLKSPIAISEGMLTFATATLLKKKLEAEGAEVFMTRKFDGGSAFGVPFETWLKKKHIDSLFAAGVITSKQKNILLNPKTSKRDKFRFVFKDLELQKRAEIINNFHPDLTIIIHYNVDETNTGWTKPANKNFNMTFVGGAFMKNDLSSPEKRFEFLRLLVSEDLERSIALSSAMVKSFEKNLNVKTATYSDAKYLIQGCLSTNEIGVYCRNLQLTRYVHGPLVYGETLYQDNINECVLLNKECDKTKNERVQQVAESYFQGILNYTKEKMELR